MRLTPLFFCLAIVFIYFGYLTLFLRDVPVGMDDVVVIDKFLNEYVLSNSLKGTLGMLFEPFQEHILATTRFNALLYWKLFDSFNFVNYALMGNFCFVGIVLLLVRHSWEGATARLVYFVPVFLLLFHAQYMQTALWPMAVWSNGWVNFWVLLSLYFLNKSGQRSGGPSHAYFGAASFIAGLATFSNGNGILVFVAGFYILWAYGSPFRRVAVWGLLFGICLVCYLSLRRSGNMEGQIFEPSLLLSPLAFLGAYLALVRLPIVREILSVAAGMFILLSFLYFSVLKPATTNRKHDAWLIASLIFVLLTAVAVGILRAGEKGLEGMHMGRYRHYSSLALCIVYLLFLRQARAKNVVAYASTVPAFLGWLLSFYVEYGYSKTASGQVVASYYNGMENGIFVPRYAHANKLAVEILKRSDSVNVHRPNLFGGWAIPKRPRTEADTPEVPLKITKFETLPIKDDGGCSKRIQLEFIGVRRPSSVSRQTFAVLRMGTKKYFLDTSARKASLLEFLLHGNYFDQNIQAQLIPCEYPRGTYTIELWQGMERGPYKNYRAGKMAL